MRSLRYILVAIVTLSLGACSSLYGQEKNIVQGMTYGAIAGASLGAVTGGLTSGQGALIGATLGGAYKMLENAKTYTARTSGMPPNAGTVQYNSSYATPRGYYNHPRNVRYSYTGSQTNLNEFEQRFMEEENRRTRQHKTQPMIMHAPAQYYHYPHPTTPYYYSDKASGYVPGWSVQYY